MTDHCEAKLHAFRRTQDGIVVAFVIHPAEVPQALALDPLGTRYMLAFAAINDDETQRDPAAVTPSAVGSPGPADAPPSARAGATHTPGDAYRSVPDVGQAAMPHAEPVPGVNPARSAAGRERYRAADDMERAVMRAGRLASDPRFQEWTSTQDASYAASLIRRHCGVNSRKELASNEVAYEKYIRLETTFRTETGQLAEIR